MVRLVVDCRGRVTWVGALPERQWGVLLITSLTVEGLINACVFFSCFCLVLGWDLTARQTAVHFLRIGYSSFLCGSKHISLQTACACYRCRSTYQSLICKLYCLQPGVVLGNNGVLCLGLALRGYLVFLFCPCVC